MDSMETPEIPNRFPVGCQETPGAMDSDFDVDKVLKGVTLY